MRRPSFTTFAAVTTLALAAAFGGAYTLHADEAPAKRRPWPKPTPPPPPSPIYIASQEAVPDAAEIAAEAQTHNRRTALDLERALHAGEMHGREAAFTFLMPELIQLEPQLLVDMVAAQKPGEARDTLRTELARQWVVRDPDAAVAWMKTLRDDERHASAAAAVRAIGPAWPERTLAIADELGIGRDRYLESVVEGWAQAHPHEVTRWLTSQRQGPRKQAFEASLERARRR
jgi:hypothetical protein